ncbi:2-dehydropantoate 2-reductase [Desulfosporosinus sp. BG]|nr:2-dehydropantoate 2-reductase [Desulfosporosinus sp. BG]
MKALLIGSGAVGLAIGASLSDVGWDLELVAKGKTKNAVEKNGIVRKGLFQHIIIPAGKVKIYEKLQSIEKGEYDFVLVCTKTTISAEIAEELGRNKRILKASGKIVLFQNGFGNDEVFLKYFDKQQIYSARVITGFTRPELNISEVTVHAAPILIGSLYGNSLDCILPLAKGINDGGIPCEVTEEIGKALWAKMLYNCTLNPMGAIFNVNYGKLTETSYSTYIMNKIIDEIFQVMIAAGYSTYWESAESYKKEFYEKLIPSTYDHRSSTLQDIEKKNITEIDSLTHVIITLGRELNIAVPYNDMIYNIIKTKECFY